MPSVFIGASTGPNLIAFGRVELVQLNALTIGSPHHREGGPDILQPDQAPDRRPFDCRLALQPEAQFDEERLVRDRRSVDPKLKGFSAAS
jgi:hypothetical protein